MTEATCVLCKDGKYVNLVPDGEFFCLPCTHDDWTQPMEVHEGRVNREQAMNECSRTAHTHHLKRCVLPSTSSLPTIIPSPWCLPAIPPSPLLSLPTILSRHY